MIIISILLLLAPGAIAMKVAGEDEGNGGGAVPVLKMLLRWMMNAFLVMIFSYSCLYIMDKNIVVSFSTEFIPEYVWDSIYFNTFVIKYGVIAAAGACILGAAERILPRIIDRLRFRDEVKK